SRAGRGERGGSKKREVGASTSVSPSAASGRQPAASEVSMPSAFQALLEVPFPGLQYHCAAASEVRSAAVLLSYLKGCFKSRKECSPPTSSGRAPSQSPSPVSLSPQTAQGRATGTRLKALSRAADAFRRSAHRRLRRPRRAPEGSPYR